MNLMKWFRRNNRKIMAIVVVVIMFGFIAGPTLRYITRLRVGGRDTIAYYDDNKKITRTDRILAQRELEILKLLRADGLLRSQDLRGILLSELLFSEYRASPALINLIKRIIRTNKLQVSDEQLADFYKRSMPSDMYWLLLSNEAQLAGIAVADEEAGRLLGRIVPQVFEGFTYSQVIHSLIERYSISEQQILAAFGKLLAVLQYAYMICSSEGVTNSQIMHAAAWENETIDAELVGFESAVFSKDLPEPNEAIMVQHFNEYKKFFAGDISDQNPYGFGYKLPDRVQLEYIAVKLDDVSKIVAHPTSQEKEEYYQKNIKAFTKKVPSDPNDPNSPQVERTQSYAEVASYISEGLLRERINSKAENILQEAKTLTEAALENINIEPEKLTSEQLQKSAGDYKAVAEQLSKKFKIQIHEGQTGELSAIDIQNDRNLGLLFLGGLGVSPVSLAQLVFAIDELKTSEIGYLGVSKPRMYENIGPLRDVFGQIMAIVRVIKAQPASEPQDIDQTFSTKTLGLDPNQNNQQGDKYCVKEKVVQDLKELQAMDITKSKAEDFMELVKADGWEGAINKFNELYGKQAKKDPNEPNTFRIQYLTGLQRVSGATLATLAIQDAGNPAAQFFTNQRKKQAMFIDKLYSLLPQDSNTVGALPALFEFKPDMGFYCIKDISVKRLNQAEYEKIKALYLYKEDDSQIQSMAAVHFNPKNILKRMNFRLAEKQEQPTDANAPAQTEKTK